MEAVEVDAVPEARDTYHAACTERVAPRGEASAVDKRVGAAARPPTPARAKLLRALRAGRRREREI